MKILLLTDHFSNRILRALRKKGVKIGYITLNCASVDTKIFEEFIEEHSVFKEYYEIPEETAELIRDTKLNGNKNICRGYDCYKDFGKL